MARYKRRMAERLAKAFGYNIVRSSRFATWPEDDFARRLFDRLKPDCVFDVGANIGQYARSLREQGFDKTILSFEPNPAAFAKLQLTAKTDPLWHCYPWAFGARTGTMPFHVMKTDVFSSFLNPTTETMSEFRDENVVARTIDVEVRTLEVCFPDLKHQHGFANPFLKMDTQGFDLEVVAGGSKWMGEFCALLSEVSIRAIYDGAPTFTESIAAYQAAGFDLAGLYSVHPHRLLKLIEYNCYCVRHDLVEAETLEPS